MCPCGISRLIKITATVFERLISNPTIPLRPHATSDADDVHGEGEVLDFILADD